MPANETIVALSTPAGESAVALIRLSGPECAELTRPWDGRPVWSRGKHTGGQYRKKDHSMVDSCLITYFAEGQLFTGEAMLEIAPHGNPLVIQLILEDLLERDCRMAEPGEFTRTAFLNGRLDLTPQAEAVADLIHARSERSLELARRQLHGSVGRKMSTLTDQLLQIMAQLEAYIDFPEEDLPQVDESGPMQALHLLIQELKALVETQRYAALLHEGVKTLIVGEPNVGKSSLTNALVGTELQVIVSERPGTTRDYLSAFIMLRGALKSSTQRGFMKGQRIWKALVFNELWNSLKLRTSLVLIQLQSPLLFHRPCSKK